MANSPCHLAILSPCHSSPYHPVILSAPTSPQPPVRAPEQQQLARQRHIRTALVDIVVVLTNLAKNAAINLGGGGDRQLAIRIQQRNTGPSRLVQTVRALDLEAHQRTKRFVAASVQNIIGTQP